MLPGPNNTHIFARPHINTYATSAGLKPQGQRAKTCGKPDTIEGVVFTQGAAVCVYVCVCLFVLGVFVLNDVTPEQLDL